MSAEIMICPISGQTRREEFWNTVTHSLGTLLSIAGLVAIVVYASLHGDTVHIVSSAVYGTTLVLLYSASSLYHGATSLKWKRIFLTCDYLAIYLLIAGTYTPLALVTLNGDWGWTILGIEWGMALIGMVVKGLMGERYRLLSTGAYLVMGWMLLVAFYPLYQSMEFNGILLMIAGGLAYTIGVIFFLWESLPLNHVIWHIFVIMGSALHYIAIFSYVMP
jgi:hemolysin III